MEEGVGVDEQGGPVGAEGLGVLVWVVFVEGVGGGGGLVCAGARGNSDVDGLTLTGGGRIRSSDGRAGRLGGTGAFRGCSPNGVGDGRP